MRYQVYLQKDVSDIINTIAKGLGKKPSTIIKDLLETNFRTAFSMAENQLSDRKEGNPHGEQSKK